MRLQKFGYSCTLEHGTRIICMIASIAAVATLTSSLVEIVRDETKFPNPVVKIFAFALNVTNCVLAVLLCLSSLVVKKLLGSHEDGVKGLEPSLTVWLVIAALCTIESLVHFVYAFVYVSWKSALVYLLPTGFFVYSSLVVFCLYSSLRERRLASMPNPKEGEKSPKSNALQLQFMSFQSLSNLVDLQA